MQADKLFGFAGIKHFIYFSDFWISPDPANAGKVFHALKKFGAPLAVITVKDFTKREMVYQMGLPPGRIDILMGPKGLEFEECWNHRKSSRYGDVKANFLSLSDLIKNKEAVGRPQDLIDLDNLRK